MVNEIGYQDDVRYQHHLKHRGWANQQLFQAFWIVVAAIVLQRVAHRTLRWWSKRCNREHKLLRSQTPYQYILSRCMAFIDAISHLPIILTSQLISFTFSLGRVIVLTAYLAIIVSALLSVDAPQLSQHFLDDVAFRAAWVTLTQVPLVYFLSTKRGPINILAGLSHERINWVHRWVGRFLFISATTHMAIMKSSISMREIVHSHDDNMAVVRYGIAAYVTLTWIAVSSILPIRQWSYRVYYLNHWVSTLGFLFIVFQHVPKYARTPIHLSLSFVVFDKCLVGYGFCRNNISVRLLKGSFSKFKRGPGRGTLVMGYPVEMIEPDVTSLSLPTNGSTTIIRICNVPFSWIPGQHVRIYIPALGPFEIHPFTPANCPDISPPPPLPPRRNQDIESNELISLMCNSRSNDMTLMIRAHSGLTRRLAYHHSTWLSLPCPNASQPQTSLTAYIDGPYGNPPAWEDYENLVFVTTSTGVSFALAVMDYLEQLCFSDPQRLQTRRVHFIWIIRHLDPQFEATGTNALDRYSTMLTELGVRVESELYVTCEKSETGGGMQKYDPFAHLRRPILIRATSKPPLSIRNPDEIYEEWDREYEDAELSFTDDEDVDPFMDDCGLSEDDETSTLVDRHEMLDDNRYSNVHWMPDENTALEDSRPLSSPIRTPAAPRMQVETPKSCQCALIQFQREKLKPKKKTISFKDVSHGQRPDIPYLLRTYAPRTIDDTRSMVAVCSNTAIAMQAKDTVSKINMDFALGRRKAGVEIFVEGFD
ncbi:hypothetical protein P153DRAFT_381240 [Dothidotthia symphoricarpi CBS 119687]|uniref:FAD-binding FR-type domain-containing protein n=1 Tax=Dothidotthia symphoricarpi CBS 119687 TaxID=1392245 RepID=A0A6A6ASD2_9PLEO|nr:uncharacterized protein P153DRAFT_381240 [Dothidotthia symphoricarpi CBS 119687]KAF2134068.1 hypothetical protein P153DRAFT_381240 [Dothidotthia symphoricarpi CBS 119687]